MIYLPCRLGTADQIVGPLAGLPGYSGSVISLCQASRSCISALEPGCEHEGAQLFIVKGRTPSRSYAPYPRHNQSRLPE